MSRMSWSDGPIQDDKWHWWETLFGLTLLGLVKTGEAISNLLRKAKRQNGETNQDHWGKARARYRSRRGP
jgi:hypothetical protein